MGLLALPDSSFRDYDDTKKLKIVQIYVKCSPYMRNAIRLEISNFAG